MVWLRKHSTLDWTLPKQYAVENDKGLTREQRIKQLETALKGEQGRNLVYKTMFDILQKNMELLCQKNLYPSNLKE